MVRNLILVLAVCLTESIQETHSVVLQIMIDFDDNSENLLNTLIKKIDHLVDPKIEDAKNATHELANAFLQLGPRLTISGNISNGQKEFSLTFNVNAKADHYSNTWEIDENNYEYTKSSGGIFAPIVNVLEPYVLAAVNLLLQGFLGVIIGQMIQGTSLFFT